MIDSVSRILVIEISDRGAPSAWVAKDWDDLAAKVDCDSTD